MVNFLYDWGYSLLPYNDIWGYIDDNGHEFALIGTWDGTHIIDIGTDPNNPQEISFIPGSFSTHRDIKTHGHYMYVGTEANLGDPALFPEYQSLLPIIEISPVVLVRTLHSIVKS